MMVPATARQYDDDVPPLPRDLQLLRLLYQGLPHPAVRWQTEPGSVFLDALFIATQKYPVRHVARTLGISSQAVYYMLERPRPHEPRRWPTQDDLRALRTAWRSVQTARTLVQRKSPEYVPVHAALTALLDQKFTLREIALAMGVRTRQLGRFLSPVLDSPEAVARAIEKFLPHSDPGESTDTGWRDTGWREW